MATSHIEYLDPSQIQRAAYQRPVDLKRAARYAQAWSDELAGVITVSRRDDVDWVVIGSHRVAAATMASQTLAAQVIEGLTYEEEARLFLENARTTVNIKIFDRHQSGLEAGDPVDIELQRVMNLMSVQLRASGKTEGHFASGINAARVLAAKGQLLRVMEVIHGAWYRPQSGYLRDALSSATLAGIGIFLNRYPTVKTQDLSRAMENYHPVDLFKTGGGSNSRAVVEVLVKWYNATKRGSNRLAS